MSTDSPAKKERIERHLMRQRGAGVRTVSATFGFAFGSSAPSSQEHTPVSIEPPTKRRKTILRNEIEVVDESVDTSIGQRDAEIVTQAEKAKQRKRWAPEDDDADSIVRSHAVDGDDSFIDGLKAAKTAAKRSAGTTTATKGKRGIHLTNESPTIKPKPRRPAVAKGIGKVANDIVEQNGSVEANRCDVEIKAKSEQPKRTRRKQKGPAEVSSDPSKTSDGLNTDTQSKATAKRSKLKLAAQSDIAEPRPLLSNQDDDLLKEADQSDRKLREAASRKRKQCEVVAEVHVADKIEAVTSEITGTKASSRTKAVKQAAVQTTQESQRVPLKESDPNVTIHVTSPDKSSAKPRRATSARSKIAERVESKEPVQHDQTKPSRRHKVQVLEDEENMSRPAQDSNLSAHVAANEKSKRQKQSAATPAAQARDEDIDWLFQDPDIKQHASLARKQLAPQKKGPRTPKKLADIDLDDLLSNIASFAQVETQGHGSHSETVQNHKPQMAGKTAKRRDRR